MKEEIVKEICDKMGITLDELNAVGTVQRFAKARFMAMYFLKNYGKLSFSQIGEELGCRSHSAVIHGIDRHMYFKNNDQKYRKIFRELRAVFNERYPKPKQK